MAGIITAYSPKKSLVAKTKKRGRYFAFILYPDDEYQMNLLRHLTSFDRLIPCKVMYIAHSHGLNEMTRKSHYHVLIAFENPLSPDSVQKMLGCVGTVWRLYTMVQTEVVYDLHIDHGSPTRDPKPIYKKVPVLRSESDPTSFIDYPYDDRETVHDVMHRHPIEDDQCYFRTPLFIVKHVELVSDFQAYALYMLHRTYQARLDGKPQYQISDLCGDDDLISRAFPCTDPLADGGVESRLFDLCGIYSQREVIKILMDNGDKEAFEFLRKYSTFVRDWFCPKFKKIK